MAGQATTYALGDWLVEDVARGQQGAVFDLDDELRVLASSAAAPTVLGRSGTSIAGKRCFEVLHGVDVETHQPCRGACGPTANAPPQGWAVSRRVEAPSPAGALAGFDCFLLRCADRASRRHNLWFLGSPGIPTAGLGARLQRAFETLYPALSGPADVDVVVEASLAAAVRATSADGAAVHLVVESGDRLVRTRTHGFPSAAMRALSHSAARVHAPALGAPGAGPLVARVEGSGGAGLPGGWYVGVPLLAGGQAMGFLGAVSRRSDFDVATAARVLLAIALQLGVYVRWVHLARAAVVPGTQGPALRSTEAAVLSISCLGPFQVAVGGKAVPATRFRRSKALTLLKFLAARRRRPVPREALIEALWPGADPGRASANLRVVLHALRHALEPEAPSGKTSSFIRSKGEMVHLDPSAIVWVDVEEFMEAARLGMELADEGRPDEALAECRRAAALYRGDYLEDEPYSDWGTLERERTREVCLNLMKRMAGLLAARGDLPAAIDACRSALGVDRGREDIHRLLMGLLCDADRRAEALRQYARCRMALAEDLGTEPAHETRALYDSIAAMVPSSPPCPAR